MATKLSAIPSYRAALDALRQLKEQHGAGPEVRAIAAFMIEAAEAELGAGSFPYVGDPGDPRDRAVVEAYQEYWRRFAEGEEIAESWHEL